MAAFSSNFFSVFSIETIPFNDDNFKSALVALIKHKSTPTELNCVTIILSAFNSSYPEYIHIQKLKDNTHQYQHLEPHTHILKSNYSIDISNFKLPIIPHKDAVIELILDSENSSWY